MYSLVQYVEIDIFLEYGTWLDELYPSTHKENYFEICHVLLSKGCKNVQIFRAK